MQQRLPDILPNSQDVASENLHSFCVYSTFIIKLDASALPVEAIDVCSFLHVNGNVLSGHNE